MKIIHYYSILFTGVLRKHLNITADNAKDVLLKFDANKNGKIEREEFYTFVKWVIAKEARDYFAPDEGKGKADLDRVMADVFRCFDDDEDGQVERCRFSSIHISISILILR